MSGNDDADGEGTTRRGEHADGFERRHQQVVLSADDRGTILQSGVVVLAKGDRPAALEPTAWMATHQALHAHEIWRRRLPGLWRSSFDPARRLFPAAWQITPAGVDFLALSGLALFVHLVPAFWAIFPGCLRAALRLKELMPEAVFPGWLAALLAVAPELKNTSTASMLFVFGL